MKKHLRPVNLILLIIMVFAALGISGCGNDDAQHTDREAMLLDTIKAAPESVRQAYRFAVEHPEILAYQPCYCGCGAMGHTSNLDCFVREIRSDGSINYDSHALGCGICVDIAQDVMRLTNEGLSQPDIRTYIDNKYSPFGPSTDTPFPQA